MKLRARVAPSRSAKVAPSIPSINPRGVAAPTHRIKRRCKPGDIEFQVRSCEIEPGRWVAEPWWTCREGSIPCDALPLHRDFSKRFESRSEAFEDAMDRGLRMIRGQSHRDSDAAEWKEKVEGLAEWVADAIHKSRAADETLPLRGLTVMDLFAGGHGGFSMGLASLGASIELACEIDPEARRVFERNVRPKRMHGDICTLDCREEKVDIVAMGLLCQAFSPAGKGLGFADPALAAAYRHSMRVLGEVDAKVVIVECARRFMLLDGGKHADEFIETMLAAGYRVQHRALNAKGFGVPQDRERSILICSRVGLPVDDILGIVFPEENAPALCVEDIMEPGVPATIANAAIFKAKAEPTGRVGDMVRVGDIDGKTSQGYRVYSTKGIGPALMASSGGKARFTGGFKVRGGARPLTAREAARMQGMPEWARQHDVQRHAMRHAGNAVATPLARELGRALAALLTA